MYLTGLCVLISLVWITTGRETQYDCILWILFQGEVAGSCVSNNKVCDIN